MLSIQQAVHSNERTITSTFTSTMYDWSHDDSILATTGADVRIDNVWHSTVSVSMLTSRTTKGVNLRGNGRVTFSSVNLASCYCCVMILPKSFSQAKTPERPSQLLKQIRKSSTCGGNKALNTKESLLLWRLIHQASIDSGSNWEAAASFC